MLYILVGDIKFLINLYSMIALPFYFLSALGVLILRRTEPDAIRPFEVWLGMPILFSSVTLFLILFGIKDAPMESITAFGIVFVGILVWLFQIRKFKLSQFSLRRTFRSLRDRIDSTRRRDYASYRRQVSTDFELNDL